MKKTQWKQSAKEALLFLPLKNFFVAIRKSAGLFGVPNKRFYWYLRFRGDFNVPVDDEHSFRLRSDGSSVENSIFWAGLTGEWEAASVDLWTKLAREARVVFDVGANTGIYALIVKAVNPNAKVYAFEPVRRIFERLEYNNKLNNYDIVCLERGVSNRDGTATFYDIPEENSYSSSLSSEFAGDRADEVTPITIETIRLDTLIKQNKLDAVDLIKIDVESYEPEVLEGLGDYLDKFKPTLLIEILSDDIARRIADLVGDKDYLYFDINDADGSVKQVERITKSSSYNYLICTKSIADQIGIREQIADTDKDA